MALYTVRKKQFAKKREIGSEREKIEKNSCGTREKESHLNFFFLKVDL